MALPYDALTAALDAWLAQYIPNATRRDRVRRAVDCLDDLRTAPLSHVEFAIEKVVGNSAKPSAKRRRSGEASAPRGRK